LNYIFLQASASVSSGLTFFTKVFEYSFLLISREETKIKGWYKYFYFGLAFTILITAEILVRYSGKSLTHGLFYYLLPLFCIPVVYIELVRRFYYENLRK